MKSLVGKTLTTSQGYSVTILWKRKSWTFPFFETFYLYDILWGKNMFSIRCNEIDNLINGKCVTFVFD